MGLLIFCLLIISVLITLGVSSGIAGLADPRTEQPASTAAAVTAASIDQVRYCYAVSKN
ncbi:hypothetical protein HQN90_15865 [Paenibacillus alba]|uniref:hypothetical protein n=1 Tax=Paenibacillus alba TaxID=1197127 RepID=UPI00156416E3|nr:hypothetical protein [Paenibacillus alba]NQX67599.1 hypothetical protein [Paenibacillus alba]